MSPTMCHVTGESSSSSHLPVQLDINKRTVLFAGIGYCSVSMHCIFCERYILQCMDTVSLYHLTNPSITDGLLGYQESSMA